MNEIRSNPAQIDRLLRLKDVIGDKGLIPVSRSTWYVGMEKGIYPQPVRLGPNTVAWRLSEILKIVEKGIPDE